MVSLSWNVLPAEMKYSVVELLNAKDTAAFAKSGREAYRLSIPTMFSDIKLNTYDAARSFVVNVPPGHCCYVRTLYVDMQTSSMSATQITNTLSELLSRCIRVEELFLRISGALKPSIITCFEKLHSLTKLSIANIGHEESSPLSERLVVSIAASIPNLTDLTVDRITRSSIHAPELLGSYPFVPIVLGDDDIPPHPLLGFNLSLPSLLQIPTLRALRVRDSHLGDPEWARVVPRCKLDAFELGSSCYESADFNRSCADQILGNLGRSVSELALGSPLSTTSTSLKRLRSLRITPFFPLECLLETLSVFAKASIEVLSIECHEDDAEDMCDALEDFLSQCVERRAEPFYGHLADISLSTITDDHEVSSCTSKAHPAVRSTATEGTAAAIQRMQNYLRDIRSSQKNAGLQPSPTPYRSHVAPCTPLRR